ncbi:hypothetical protein Sste5346_005231 [Sporothrix stenoceras]|uniref:Carbohydrate esterase family 16 protein n=1 Tax=Sporothrix stenoceras TaxID=5173 RepID=A0ABR3Z5S9_9PEZI
MPPLHLPWVSTVAMVAVTGFNYTGVPPSIDNSLGNPAYPGWTSSNGPNWVDYLTVDYNASRLLTYNLAFGGATVDSDIIKPYQDSVLSLKDQVHSEFLPGYTSHGNSDTDNSETHPSAPNAPAWKGSDSVFAIWIGINDVGNSYSKGPEGVNGTKATNARIFDVYSGMVDLLYNAGARNFVFLTVPPVDRSPSTVVYGDAAAALEKADIAAFNSLLKDGLAADLKAQHADNANVWAIDTGVLFNTAIDNPTAYPQTAGLKNTTDFCQAYANGFSGEDKYIKSCGVSVNKYFWLNNLHPTTAIHKVVAEHVSNALTAGPNICSNGVDTKKRASL